MNEPPAAIVTGAGSGIGRQTAIQLAQKGWRLMLVSRTEPALKETQAACRDAAGPQTQTHPADITHPAAAAEIVQQALHHFARIDALANVAGYAPLQPIEHTTPQIAQACVDTNLTAVINLTAAAWPTMTSQHAGVIVNVSSVASFDPFPGLAAYAAAKVGVNMFTQCTAREGQPHNIKAVALAPGAVETPMLRAILDESTFPKEKTLDPDDVAERIVAYITGELDFTPGQTVLIPNP